MLSSSSILRQCCATRTGTMSGTTDIVLIIMQKGYRPQPGGLVETLFHNTKFV